MKLFSLLPKRLVHFACNSPATLNPRCAGIAQVKMALNGSGLSMATACPKIALRLPPLTSRSLRCTLRT